MGTNNEHITKSNKSQIEIKTLAQIVSDEADKALAALMNDGWELLCDPAINTVTVPDTAGPGWRARHYEIVKLVRTVEEIDPVAHMEAGTISCAPPTPRRTEKPGENGRPPLTPLHEVKRGTVLGVEAAHPLHVERKPLEEVTYHEALYSGKYTPEEVSEIATREARANTLANLKWEKQQWGDRTWEGLVNRLPPSPFKCSPRVIGGVST